MSTFGSERGGKKIPYCCCGRGGVALVPPSAVALATLGFDHLDVRCTRCRVAQLLAERELASGRLVRPLVGLAEDVRYVGHHLVFPRSTRQRHSLRLFMTWLGIELGLQIEAPF